MASSSTIQFQTKGLWTISLTVFMVSYNVSVMPAIMPAIVSDFGASMGYIQSILVLFSLVTAAFAPTAENLCRFYGRTPVFLTGLICYGLGISLTALSPSLPMMTLTFSLLAGLAASPLVSTPWTIVDLVYDGKSEEQAMVILIVTSALGAISGALLGGYLASQLGWRWAFAPSLLVLILVWRLQRLLPQLVIRSQQSIDWVGGLLSLLGLGSILSGISLAGDFGWWQPKRLFTIAGYVLPPFRLSIVPTLIAAGLILMGLFLFWQRRQATRFQISLWRAGLLRKRGFVLGMFTAMIHTIITTGVQFNLFQYLPTALSLNPFQTALAVIPYNLTVIITVVSNLKYLKLSDRICPKYIVFSGIIFLASGIGMLYLNLNFQFTSLQLLPGLIAMGVGSGLFLSYVSRLTYATAAPHEKPEGSGIYNPVQNLGSSLGRAILGTTLIFFTSRDIVDGILQKLGRTLTPIDRNRAIMELQEMIQTLSKPELRETLSEKLPSSVVEIIRPIGLEAARSGMQTSLLIALLFTGFCFLLATTLPKYPSRS